jgi:hypothetical protein
MRKLVSLIALLIFLVGCQKTIDGSSEEAFQQSVSDMKEGMTEAEREKFDEALVVIAMKDVDLGAMMAGVQDGETIVSDTRRALEGKSADEVLAWADEIRERQQKKAEQRQQEQLAEEIAEAKRTVDELRKAESAAQAARDGLESFVVTEPKFYKRKQRFGNDQPIIDFKVTNNTGKPISRAYFRGTLKSPGRAVAWHEDTFNYSIPGGLEPGESAHWKLEPNMFSDWGTAEVGSDALLNIEVMRLDGADGEPLFDASGWGPEEQERLEKLTEFLANPSSD